MRGSLYEVNARLVKTPDLIRTHPASLGYIAIIAPKLVERKLALEGLDTPQQYHNSFRARKGGVNGYD
eukprot:m.134801 g.134801  ORF g.134801 m.134801 type:complete len:68 (+) comp14700_c0_seq20:401-604(+)